MRTIIPAILLGLAFSSAWARVAEMDDSGKTVSLERQAKRIVSLAPSITELLYASGAGGRIVGAVDYSDYPEDALRLPRVGDAQSLDIERIASFRPDLVVAWKTGNSIGQIRKLEDLGLTVFFVEPRHLSDIPVEIEKLGRLAGTGDAARHSALEFRSGIADLKNRYSGMPPVKVFYEIWPDPLMTINDDHIISDVMRLCGARNVFGNLPLLAPTVSLEAVLKADPDAIIGAGEGDRRPPWLAEWKKWKIKAARHLYFIPADLISRPSPRILQGAKRLCEAVDEARQR